MSHHSWTGTPRDHRLASRPRLARAILLVGSLALAGCADDDNADSVAVTPEPTDPGTSAAATTTESSRVEPSTVATDPPPTTEATPTRCGDGVEPSGPVELIVWHGLTSKTADEYLPDAVARFEEAHPGITVELVKGDIEYPSGLPSFVDPSVSRPDVMFGSNLTVRSQADSGLFIPVEACTGGETPPQFDGLLPAVDRTYRVNGTLWGAPYNVSTPVLIYDGNLWRGAGVDPDQPPETIDELLDTAETLYELGAARSGLTLYNGSALWLITETAAKEGRLLVEPNNGHDVDTIEVARIATVESLELLDRLRGLESRGVIQWTRENVNDEDLALLAARAQGTAMTLHTSAALGEIYDLVEAGAFEQQELRVGPMPGPAPGAIPGGGSWWLPDGDDDDRTAAAWQFIDWMTQPERIAELAAFSGYVPTTPAAVEHPITVESWEQRPQLRVGYEQVAATPGTPAAVGVQVGPRVEFMQAIEIGTAYIIDVGNDPRLELENAVTKAMESVQAYEAGR